MCLEPRKEKTDVNATGNGTLSPNNEQQCQGTLLPPPGGGGGGGHCESSMKPERPNSLGPNKLSRRIICYHGDHCKFKISFLPNIHICVSHFYLKFIF